MVDLETIQALLHVKYAGSDKRVKASFPDRYILSLAEITDVSVLNG